MKTDAWGIQAEYEGAAGKVRTVPESSLSRIRAAMGDPPPPALSWHDEQVKVIRQNELFRLPADAVLMLEDETTVEASNQLPRPLPIGYHTGLSTGERACSNSIRRSVAPAARSRSPHTSDSTATELTSRIT